MGIIFNNLSISIYISNSNNVIPNINWALTGMGYFRMREKIEKFMEESGGSPATTRKEYLMLLHRKIADNVLILECITSLTRSDLERIKIELASIARTLPQLPPPL